MASKGQIWLANLNPVKKNNEVGKVRPVVIFQNNALNHNGYPTTIILPLSTQLIDDVQPIRMRISKRGKLMHDSDIIVTQIRAIDNSRFIKHLADVTEQEFSTLKKLLLEIIE
ncbi:MAG: type II toxin-antitoxin system PemK/MazF family toxin [Sulfurovum sp.]|nr:type II toxin-antitoxin system PemK/MazF family toxin [Sulfurovum sp.]